jgi:C4-dicarboxylate-specific signal transduction histidine kinase
LRALLREHHDVRGLLSAACLQAGMLRDAPAGHAAARLAALEASLRGLVEFVESVKTRTLSELALADGRAPVNLSELLGGVAAAVRQRHPTVAIALEERAPETFVHVAGGPRGLTHVLSGLLLNACEGDGSAGARSVAVHMRRDPREVDGVRVEVSDDGPGFPAAVLATAGHSWLTTKATGAGLGLALARSLVESSGGSFDLGNRPEGGGWVAVWLPSP